jgi:ATP-dependent DNA helicase RecQ
MNIFGKSSLSLQCQVKIANLTYVQITRDAWNHLGGLKKEFPRAPILLMSATVSQGDARRMMVRTGLENMKIIRSLQNVRSELTYQVQKKKDNRNETLDDIQKIVKDAHPGSCIIYCATPEQCNNLFCDLRAHIDPANMGVYHGKLPEKERNTALQKWQNGSYRTMIATSSFGMGIHMLDVRRVVHYVFPLSMSKLNKPI